MFWTSVERVKCPISYKGELYVSIPWAAIELNVKSASSRNRTYEFARLGALTIQPWMQRDSASELGFGIPSWASISSVKGDSRKDGIRRRVSRTNKIRVEKGELAKLDKIGMGIGTCIDVPYRLMLPGWCDVFHQLTEDLIIGISIGPARIEIGAGSIGSFWKRSAPM